MTGKRGRYVVCTLEGEYLDTFDSKDAAVMWSAIYDGTWESAQEYLERKLALEMEDA